MTVGEKEPNPPGLRLVYDWPRYRLIEVAAQFAAIHNVWYAGLTMVRMGAGLDLQDDLTMIAAVRALDQEAERLRRTQQSFEDERERLLSTSAGGRVPRKLESRLTILSADSAEVERQLQSMQPSIEEAQDRAFAVLHIDRMSLASPLEAALAAAGSSATIVYGLHLLARVLRNPEGIGSWWPRVRLGWERTMTDVDNARRLREVETNFENAVQELHGAAEVAEPVNAGGPPEELVGEITD